MPTFPLRLDSLLVVGVVATTCGKHIGKNAVNGIGAKMQDKRARFIRGVLKRRSIGVRTTVGKSRRKKGRKRNTLFPAALVFPLSASITPDLLNENFDPIKHRLPWAAQARRPTTPLPLSVTTTAALLRTFHLGVWPRFPRTRLNRFDAKVASLARFPIFR